MAPEQCQNVYAAFGPADSEKERGALLRSLFIVDDDKPKELCRVADCPESCGRGKEYNGRSGLCKKHDKIYQDATRHNSEAKRRGGKAARKSGPRFKFN